VPHVVRHFTETPAEIEGRDSGAAVRAAMRRLPGERQALLSLRYFDELNIREIADVLGIAEGTVKSRLHHAREQLREILERTST